MKPYGEDVLLGAAIGLPASHWEQEQAVKLAFRQTVMIILRLWVPANMHIANTAQEGLWIDFRHVSRSLHHLSADTPTQKIGSGLNLE